ncbi:MAG TPA: hypothetical protein VGC66_07160 [Pyrinomonadaceae bacterium]|jgi:hypothetical protein
MAVGLDNPLATRVSVKPGGKVAALVEKKVPQINKRAAQRAYLRIE